jgi:hypothetical protein
VPPGWVPSRIAHTCRDPLRAVEDRAINCDLARRDVRLVRPSRAAHFVCDNARAPAHRGWRQEGEALAVDRHQTASIGTRDEPEQADEELTLDKMTIAILSATDLALVAGGQRRETKETECWPRGCGSTSPTEMGLCSALDASCAGPMPARACAARACCLRWPRAISATMAWLSAAPPRRATQS